MGLEHLVRIYLVPAKLYESEINFMASTFWDGGFVVKLGDHLNGFKACGNFDTWTDACEWLAGRACEHFPGSCFFGWWKHGGG